jgi:hypothetical protein
MKSPKSIIRLFASIGVLVPWFLRNESLPVIFGLSLTSYFILISSDVLAPREKYWWWDLIGHIVLFLALFLMVAPHYFNFGVIAKSLGLLIGLPLVVLIGYGARMQLIGRSDPLRSYLIERFFGEKNRGEKG